MVIACAKTDCVECLRREIHDLRARIAELEACRHCGQPFTDGVLHVNCADTSKNAAENQEWLLNHYGDKER